MTEIRFYHLTRMRLDQALPELLEKTRQRGWRALVQVKEEGAVEPLTKSLWAGCPDSFLPHGSAKDGNAAQQPIWVTEKTENPNEASVLFLAEGAAREGFDGFDLVCEVFDGNDDVQVGGARARWSSYKEAEHSLTYWQQTENGWEKKG